MAIKPYEVVWKYTSHLICASYGQANPVACMTDWGKFEHLTEQRRKRRTKM